MLSIFGSLQADTNVTTAPSINVQGDRNIRLAHQQLGRGESELSVVDVLQDNNGFVWVGTEDGLYRIGGTRVTSFSHSRSDNRTLVDDEVVD
ncbi:MAG: two-component regulator propeller domain-containing protein, partial [Pseudomonadales bacterium]